MRSSLRMRLLACAAGAVVLGGAAHAQEGQVGPAAPDEQVAQTVPGQQAPQAESPRNSGIDTVIVTAERREVDLTEIPVAISAFTSDMMETIGLDTVTDLASYTPGLVHSFTNDRLTVRGVGRFTNTRATEGGVAIYLDGLYTSTASGLMRSDIYVDRFEVLRGPQGTLYGRNSVGGAVNLISKRPSDTFEGEVRAIFANYDRTEFEAMVSGPITDNIRYRIAGNKTDQTEGYWENVSTVGTGTDEGMVEDRSYYEIQLEGELLNNDLEWWIKYGFERWDSSGGGTTGRATSTFGIYNNFSPVTGTTPNLLYGYGGNTLGSGQRPENTDMRTFRSSERTPVVQDLPHIVGHLTYHLPTFDVKYIGGYSNYNYYSDGPANGLDRIDPFTLSYTDFPTAGAAAATNPFNPGGSAVIDPRSRSIVQQYVWWQQHDLNFASTYDGPLQVLAGLYMYDEGSNDYLGNVNAPFQPQYGPGNVLNLDGTPAPDACPIVAGAPGAGGNIPCNSWFSSSADTVTKTYGAYAQFDWQATEEWKFVAGLRYTLDQKEVFERVRILCFLGASCAAQQRAFGPDVSFDMSSLFYQPDSGTVVDPSVVVPAYTDAQGRRARQLEQEWDDWTWTLGADWQPTADTMIYGKYSKGYKSGGFNSGSLAQFTTTEPESVFLYELGAKQTFADQLQVNAALYYQDYQNMQIPLTVFNQVTQQNQSRFENMAKSEIAGIELETTWSPIENLNILANYSYLQTDIKEACCYTDPQDPLAADPEANPSGAPVLNAGGAITAQPQDLAGNNLPFATPHRFTLNANYTFDFDAGSLTPSVSAIYKGETYYSVFNREYNLGKPSTHFDARLIWRDADDRYSIIGYVRNISNQTVIEGVGASVLGGTFAPNAWLNRSWSLAPPRTYGVELQYRF